MSHSGKFILAVATAYIVFLVSTSIAQDTSNFPYMNPKLSPEELAADLVHRMTLSEKASERQNNSAAVPRLKVPAYQWWSEALHGVINEGITGYPEPIGLAATFDAPGNHTMAVQIGIEGRIKHVQNVREGDTGIMGGLDFWSPNSSLEASPIRELPARRRTFTLTADGHCPSRTECCIHVAEREQRRGTHV